MANIDKSFESGDHKAGRSISLRDVSLLARVASLCGFDIESVLADVGIRTSDVQDEGDPGDVHLITTMMDLGVQRSIRAYFPFALGEHYAFEHTPEIQTFLATCSSLHEALWLLDFLPHFIHPSMTARYEIAAERFTIFFELHDASGALVSSPGLTETVLVVLNRVLHQLLGQHACPEVTFRHQPMTNLAAYEKQLGAPPRFGGTFDGASHPLALLDRPIPGSSPSLHAKIRLLLDQRLQRLQEAGGLENTLSSMLRRSPAMTVAQASSRLGIQTRTLQRRLKKSGRSFAAIQAQARFQAAKSMLADHDLDIDTIALKLGFSDRTTFSKSFSKWSGLPPATYRRVRSK
ncbi:helix-turn-helix domain-containing protein [Rhodanobacter sp. BL-MT-08]